MAAIGQSNISKILYKCPTCSVLHTKVEGALQCCSTGTKTDPAGNAEQAKTLKRPSDRQIKREQQDPDFEPREDDDEGEEEEEEEREEELRNDEDSHSFLKDDFFRTHRRGGKRILLWQPKDIVHLISLVRKNSTRFMMEPKSRIWNDIVEEMKLVTPNKTYKQIRLKWAVLACKAKSYQTEPKTQQPKYYNKVKPIINYLHLVKKGDEKTINAIKLGLITPETMDLDPQSLVLGSREDAEVIPTPEVVSKLPENQKQVEKSPHLRQKMGFLSTLMTMNQGDETLVLNPPGHKEVPPRNIPRYSSDEVDHNLTFQELVVEVRRHNSAVEKHNTWMRTIFANIAESIEERNGILKDVVDKELSADT